MAIRNNVRTVRQQDGESQWRSLDQYNSSYWSGLDMQLYVNGIFVDELVHLQWEVQEAVRPLYNYSSYTYVRAVRGARRVSGTFSINYKRDAYIFELLRQIDKNISPTAYSRNSATNAEMEASKLAKSGRGTVEDLMALSAAAGTVTNKKTGRKKLDMNAVDEIAKQFEDAILGGVPPPNSIATELYSRVSLSSPLLGSSLPMDFNVRFGSPNSDAQYGGTLVSKLSPEVGVSPPVVVQTGHLLSDVQIVSRAISIDDSGRPIFENYGFLAKDVV